MRVNTALRNAGEHRCPPGVSPQQPIALPAHEFVVAAVSGHALVKGALRDQRGQQIVRAPYKRNAYAIRIFPARRHAPFDAIAIISGQDTLQGRIGKFIERKVADVHEWIILIMTGLFAAHP